MTVLMNAVESSPNPTAPTAGANRAAASAISGQWNAPATFSRISLPPGVADRLGHRVDALLAARDDHLARAVVVGRPDVVALRAELLDLVVVELEHGRHAATARRAAALIRPRSFTSRTARRGQRHPPPPAPRTRRRCGRPRRRRAGGLPAVTARNAASDVAISAGWVISVRDSCSIGPSKLTAPHVEAGSRPTPRSNTVGGLGEGLGQLRAHADALAALAREAEGDPCSSALLRPLHHARSPGQAAAEADHQHDVARR